GVFGSVEGFSRDGKLLLLCGGDSANGGWDSDHELLLLWNVATKEKVRPAISNSWLPLFIHPDEKTILSLDFRNVVHVRELKTGKERRQFSISAKSGDEQLYLRVAFSRDGSLLATALPRKDRLKLNALHPIRIWDIAKGKELCQL